MHDEIVPKSHDPASELPGAGAATKGPIVISSDAFTAATTHDAEVGGASFESRINTDLIEEHIQLVHLLAGDAAGLISLSRIRVNARTGNKVGVKPQGMQTRLFRVGDTAGMVGQAVEWAKEPGTNVYIGNAVYRPDLSTGRGKDADVVRLLAFVLDSDADKGKVAHIEGLNPNYVITTSVCAEGDNTQLYYVLAENDGVIATDDEARRQLLQRIGAELRKQSGADAGGDLVRISRLAGTVNWPDDKKISRGRVPNEVIVAKPDDGTGWSISNFCDVLGIEHAGAACGEQSVPPGQQSEKPEGQQQPPKQASATISAKQLSPRDVKKITRAAPFIDWRDRGNWLRWGQALHHATGGSQQGYQLWSEFSAKGAPELFDPADQRRVWNSIKDERKEPVTLGSYFQAAAAGALKVLEKGRDDAKTDPGAMLAEAMIVAARVVKDGNKADYIRFRMSVKKLKGIRIGDWDELVDEAEKTAAGDEDKQVADRLVELARGACELFHDDDREPYATFNVNGHRETWPVRSTGFSEWLSQAHYRQSDRAPSENALKTALTTIAGTAKFDGDMRPVFMRVAKHDGAYWLDLCDAEWRAVRIDKTGWQIVERPPVMFIRTAAMRPLPDPVRGGRFEDLWQLVNVREKDRGLVLAAMVECLRPDTHYPVMVFHGEHGSAKSRGHRTVRDVIDPNDVSLRSAPNTREDIQVAAVNNHIVSYENLSRLSGAFQDEFCVLSTGGGFAKRTLWTNTEETVKRTKRPVILNGITVTATNADLLSRTILVELLKIECRKTDTELDAIFAEKQPGILGGLLDIFSRALGFIDAVQIERDQLPRMADFAVLGEAVYSALGKTPGTFLKDYTDNQGDALVRSLDASTVGTAIMNELNKPNGDPIKGTIGELWVKLKPQVGEWPMSARGFGEQLRQAEPAMRRQGISVTVSEKPTAKGYHCYITRTRG